MRSPATHAAADARSLAPLARIGAGPLAVMRHYGAFVDAGNAVEAVTLADIRAARGVAGAVAKHTPVVSSVVLSNDFGRPVVLKAENLQRTGSFKIRGAMNKVASLGPARQGRRHGRKRRQPRPVAGVRRQVLRRAVRDLRPGRGADLQDRGVPQPRGDGDRDGGVGRRGDRRGEGARRPRRQGVLPSLRRPGGRRRAGHARSRARRGPRRPQLRRRPDRRRWPRQRRRHRRQVVDAPRPGRRRAGSGVQPVRRRHAVDRGRRDARRRDRRQASRRAHRDRSSTRGSTTS